MNNRFLLLSGSPNNCNIFALLGIGHGLPQSACLLQDLRLLLVGILRCVLGAV